MKITEILVESQQLDEGPLMNKIGTAIGKGAGTLAKGLGAVAGGVVGAGKALKKGYDAGKNVVGKAGDFEEPAGSAASAGAPSAQDVNAAGPTGTPQAKPVQGTAAKQAVAKTAQATAGQDAAQAGQTMYMQVKSNIDKLDKKGKQRILALLQKSLQQAPAQPAAAPAAAPAQKPTAAPAVKKPVKVVGKKPAAAPVKQPQVASKENKGNLIAEGFSLYRKS